MGNAAQKEGSDHDEHEYERALMVASSSVSRFETRRQSHVEPRTKTHQRKARDTNLETMNEVLATGAPEDRQLMCAVALMVTMQKGGKQKRYSEIRGMQRLPPLPYDSHPLPYDSLSEDSASDKSFA